MNASSRTIPLADRQRIYRILADRFEFGKATPMATVAFALMDAGVDKEDYGYKKLKAFLADMDDFLSFTDIIAGGVPQRLVTVNKRDDWTSERTPDAPEAVPGMPSVVAGEPGQPPCGAPYGGEALTLARRMAQTPEYVRGPVPRGIMSELRPQLSSFAYFPPATLDILRENAPGVSDVARLLDEDWGRAYEAGALRYYEGKVVFPLHVMRSDGKTPIEISIRHVNYQNEEEKPWYLCYVNAYVPPSRSRRHEAPSLELEKFARLGPWDQFLGELAGLALPESWDFDPPSEGGAQGRWAILKSYIRMTFYRLKLEDKICIDDGGSFAAFNTGLATRRYDDIYACFEPLDGASTSAGGRTGAGGAPSWRFAGFCTGGSRGLGKRLVGLFSPLPEPASYFERKDDLLFDLEKELIIDFEHVLVDNIGRLPVPFLEDELRGNDAATELLARGVAGDAAMRAQCFAELGEIVRDDARLFRRLRRCVDDAVEIARKRVRWNFKTAIPCYYPRTNSMSLLLPLCLVEDGIADAALVVQPTPSNNYQGQTILTMRQAYMDARLICRPDSEWLTTAGCGGPADEEEPVA